MQCAPAADDHKRTEYLVAHGLHFEGNDYQDVLWRILRHLELVDEVEAS